MPRTQQAHEREAAASAGEEECVDGGEKWATAGKRESRKAGNMQEMKGGGDCWAHCRCERDGAETQRKAPVV